MRINDIINESNTGSLSDGVAEAMPSTYIMPELKNQDPYLQYRFGLALAAARAHNAGEINYNNQSKFGEDMVVVARSPEEEKTLELALNLIGIKNQKNLVSTRKSEEAKDVNTTSPVLPNTRKLNKN